MENILTMDIPKFIDIHTHGQFAYGQTSNLQIKSLGYEDIILEKVEGLSSAGIHPWWTQDYSEKELEALKEHIQNLCLQKKLFALGECGLDRVYKETLSIQKDLFKWHINLSEKEKLPLIIHSVRSGSDILEIIKDYRPQMPWVFHDFRGNKELVESILKLHPHVYFSFGLSLDNSQTVRELFRELKYENIFLETDAQKHLDICDIYLRGSEQLGIDVELLKSLIMKNFKRLCMKI